MLLKAIECIIGEALKANRTLETLYWYDAGIEKESGIAIGKALKVNSSLKYLDIKYNELLRKGGIVFGEMVKVNKMFNIDRLLHRR